MRAERLVGFGNGSASYTGRGGAAGAAGYGVNDNGSTAVAEDRVIIGAKGNVWRDGSDMGRAIGSDYE